jgi:hypothetical protein
MLPAGPAVGKVDSAEADATVNHSVKSSALPLLGQMSIHS